MYCVAGWVAGMGGRDTAFGEEKLYWAPGRVFCTGVCILGCVYVGVLAFDAVCEEACEAIGGSSRRLLASLLEYKSFSTCGSVVLA